MVSFIFMSCSNDETEPLAFTCNISQSIETKYTTNIKGIIDNSCAYSGCHIGAASVIGDYSNYEGLKIALDNGTFSREVIEFMTMPPLDALGPSELSEEELSLLICWEENGYPE